VIHPDPAQISPRALEAFVVRLNSRMAAATLTSDLQAFEAHPDSEFCIGGVYTPRSPYPSFQVLSRTLLKTASDSLLGSRYYAHFSPPVRLPWHVAHGPPAASYVPTVSSRNGVYSTSQLSCLGDEARERSAHLPRRLHEGQSTLECRDAAAVRRRRSLGR